MSAQLKEDGNVSGRSDYSRASLMFNEKFDTWLNLEPLVLLKRMIKSTEEIINDIPKGIPKKTWKIVNSISGSYDIIRNAKVSPLLPACLNYNILTNSPTKSHVREINFRTFNRISTDAALLSIYEQLNHIYRNQPNCAKILVSYGDEIWDKKLRHLPQEAMGVWYVYEDLNNVLNTIKQNAMRSTHSQIQERKPINIRCVSIDATIILMGDIIVFSWNNQDWLLSMLYFLEVFNKVSELSTTLIYAHLCAGTCMPNNYYNNVVEYLKHILGRCYIHLNLSSKKDDLTFENRYFVYLKGMEGLGVAELIKRGDALLNWSNLTLQKSLWGALRDDNIVREDEYYKSDLSKIYNRMTIPEIANVLGLVKLGGHPSIDIKKGLDKLYDRTHNTIKIDETVRSRCQGVMIRDFTRNYYIMRKRLPPLDVPQDRLHKSHILVKKYNKFSSEGLLYMRSVMSLDDWSDVKLGKCAEFDEVENQISLLKDKSLGQPRSKVKTMFLLSTGGDDGIDPEQRLVGKKALIEYLMDESFEETFKKYFSAYKEDEWSDLVLEYLVIKLTAKELEFKEEGRMFGASPGPERNRRIVQEINVFTFMDKYVPEQLLTPDELTIIEKLVSFRNMKKVYRNHVIINVSFDFSRWNNNMRSETVDKTADAVLGGYYGTKVYGNTMRAFQEMLVYYADATTSRFWEGQYGGIDGLNQATWSIVFIGGIKYALESTGYRSSVTVKGDDVRAAILVPKSVFNSSTYDEVRNQIMTNIQNLCTAMGWELNPQESFVSLSLISTSKQYLFNDTWLPMSTKKVMKMESHANIIFPNLEDLVASVYSIAHSTCSQATSIMPSYVCATLLASRLLTRHCIRNDKSICNADMIACLLLWPQVLGGPGPLPLQTFIVRGENDMLSASISLLRGLLRFSNNSALRKKVRNILSQSLNPNPNERLLLGDPYSIDIKGIPERPSIIIKQLIRKAIRKFCKNKNINRLLSLKAEEQKTKFEDTLLSIRPRFNKILTALYECSPYYVIEELLAKFTQSSTILSFLSKSREKSMFSKSSRLALDNVSKAASNRWVYWSSIVNIMTTHSDLLLGLPIEIWLDAQTCNTTITHMVREKAWGVKCEGITYPSLVDQFRLYTDIDINRPGVNTNGLIRSAYSVTLYFGTPYTKYDTDNISDHYSSSNMDSPWLGSRTSTKLEFPEISSNIQSPVINKLMKLIGLWKTCEDLGTIVSDIIKLMLKAYTSHDLQGLLLFKPRSGKGHIAHRVQINSFSMVTMPNMRPNISQCMDISKQTPQTQLAMCADRYTMNEAARYFYSIFLASMPLQNMELYPSSIFHKSLYILPHIPDSEIYNLNNSKDTLNFCHHCMEAVPDPQFTGTIPPDLDFSFLYGVTMVSCSENEEITIMKNMEHVLNVEARKIITTMTADPKIDINYKVAIRTLISQLMLSGHFNAMIMKEWSNDMTHNDKIADDILEITCPISIVHDEAGSLTWAACEPDALYQALYNECFYLFYTNYGNIMINSHENNVMSMNITDYETILPVFAVFAKAGVLPSLTHGCATSQIISQPLVWDYGSDKDPIIAARCFIRHHWNHMKHVIESIEYTPDPPPIVANLYSEMSHAIRSACKSLVPLSIFLLLDRIPKSNQVTSTKKHLMLLWNRICTISIDSAENPSKLVKLRDREIVCTHIDIAILYCVTTIEICVINNEYDENTINHIINQEKGLCSIADLSANPLEDYPLMDPSRLSELRWPKIMIWNCPKRHRNQVIVNIMELLVKIKNNFMLDPTRGDSFTNEMFNLVDIWERMFKHNTTRTLVIKDVELMKDTIFSNRSENQYLITLNPKVVNVNIEYVRSMLREACTCPLRLIAHSEVQMSLPYPASVSYPEHLKELLNSAYEVANYQINNEYKPEIYNLTRIFGYKNHAIYRYLELFNALSILQNRNNLLGNFSALTIGDGAGSVSRTILKLFKKSYVVMSTLQRGPDGSVPYDSNLISSPLELTDLLYNRDYKDRIYTDHMFPGNFLLESVRTRMKTLVGQIPVDCQLIVSDADIFRPNSKVDINSLKEYLYHFVKLSLELLVNGGLAIIRLNLIPDINFLSLLCYFLSTLDHAHLYQPFYCKHSDLELFLVMIISTNDRVRHNLPRDFNNFSNYIRPYISTPIIRSSLQQINNVRRQKGNIVVGTYRLGNYLNISLNNRIMDLLCPLSQLTEHELQGVADLTLHLCTASVNLIERIDKSISSDAKTMVMYLNTLENRIVDDRRDAWIKCHKLIISLISKLVLSITINILSYGGTLGIMDLKMEIENKINLIDGGSWIINNLNIESNDFSEYTWVNPFTSVKIYFGKYIMRGITAGIRVMSHICHANDYINNHYDQVMQEYDHAIFDSYDVNTCCVNNTNQIQIRNLHKSFINLAVEGSWVDYMGSDEE